MPLLSVVTPSYNMAAYLPETLDSVAALATPHEHLVMDGGSSDGTVQLLEGRGDPSLSWVSEPDRGQTHAVNKGLERASGEFVAWLNADDTYVPDAVDRAVARLQASPELAAVYGFLEIVDESAAHMRTYVPAPFSWRRFLWLGDYVPTPTIIFRRALLDARGLLDERWKDAADYDFYLRLLHGVRVERVDEPLVRFRYHAASKTARQQGVQQQEAFEIRRQWARSPRDAALMLGVERAKQAAYRAVPPWPPDPRISRVVDTAYALRERLAGRG